MIGSWEIEQLDNPDLFYDLSLAYLDTSIVAIRQMVYGSFFPRFSHSRVVLSMAYHSTELFLKGAILRAAGKKKRGGHDLKTLYEEFSNLYPEAEFQFDLPFSIEYLGFTPEEVAEMRKKEPPQDQIYRYHTDLSGEKWEGLHGFEPEHFLDSLYLLQEAFIRLGRLIHRG